MFAFSSDKTINVSADIGRAMVGVSKGYKVELHAVPGYLFNVEADSVDHAQSLCVSLCNREGMTLASTGATVQRIV